MHRTTGPVSPQRVAIKIRRVRVFSEVVIGGCFLEHLIGAEILALHRGNFF